ncbi:MAG: MOSC domain-containing protein [Epsilonproteobacteria bacterium]|nr:MOSC domain-containing protein [Campylobacterota bacterium]
MLDNTQAKVLRLYISTGDKANPRKEVESITVDPNGVVGDKFYAKDTNRAILLASVTAYEMAKENNIELEAGALGENIYLDINPCSLIPGDKVTIGEVAFEITQNCTLCKGLSSISSKLPKLLKDDRGIFAKALYKGTIRVGDSVELHRS